MWSAKHKDLSGSISSDFIFRRFAVIRSVSTALLAVTIVCTHAGSAQESSSRAQTKSERIQKQITRLRADLQTCDENIRVLAERVKRLRQKNNELESALSEVRKSLQRLKKKIKTFRKELSQEKKTRQKAMEKITQSLSREISNTLETVKGQSRTEQEDKKSQGSYTVKRGDTLSTIGKAFNVSPAAIKKRNDLEGNVIYPGQRLVIPPQSE